MFRPKVFDLAAETERRVDGLLRLLQTARTLRRSARTASSAYGSDSDMAAGSGHDGSAGPGGRGEGASDSLLRLVSVALDGLAPDWETQNARGLDAGVALECRRYPRESS